MRAPVGTRLLFAVLAGLGLMFASQTARAACNATQCTIADVAEAQSCIDFAASFAGDGEAWSHVVNDGWSFTPQDATVMGQVLLPLTHETPGAALSGYRASCVQTILDFVSDPAVLDADLPGESDVGAQVLYEASFRKASAHGMFGDDRLLRALNAALDPNLPNVLGDPIRDALLHFDTRVCRPVGADPATLPAINGFETLCQSRLDCAPAEMCAGARFDDGQTGLFGAIQEYRIAEQAIAEAIRTLGIERFRDLDRATASGCGGIGCAGRLLVRLGALRSRAQAERLELQWRRAFAQGALIIDAPVCAGGAIGASCVVDGDCDTTSPSDGVCGSGEKERALVQVRQSAAEALAETTVAISLYGRVAPEAIAMDGADTALLANAMAEISSIANRSARSLTPFGLPPGYVPFLSDTQRELLQCDATVSVFGCLQFLLEDDTVGVLQALDSPANQAPLNLDAYADAVRGDQFDQQMSVQFEDVIVRMFGLSCEASGCTCSEAEQAEGRCFNFQGRTWVIEGVACDDPSDPFQSCSTSGVDGALEQQLESMRNAQIALENIAIDIRRNAESYDQTISSFLTQQGIAADRCIGFEAAVTNAGNMVSEAIDRRRSELGPSKLDNLASTSLRFTGALSSSIFSKNPGPIFGFFGGQADRRIQEKERSEDLYLQRTLAEIENSRQIQTNRVQCESDIRQIVDVTLPDALFNVETQLIGLIARAREQQGAVNQAEISANQLITELLRARQRFDEAVEIEDIWDANDFRNPQNYRALALEQQLEAADALRRAQLITWFLLRAVAYDLARPDLAVPLRGQGAGTVIELGQCSRAACAGDPSQSCITNEDCSVLGPCQSTAQPSDVADSSGSCSLQAVFATRDVEDLRSLIRSAFLELALTFRDTACDDDVCDKTIRFRDVFFDAFDPEQPPLGELLSTLSLDANNEAVLDFGITLERDFNICPALPDLSRQCQPNGIVGLVDDASGPADNASDFWNARLISVQGSIRYRDNRAPDANLCRNPADGRPVGPAPAQECFGVSQGFPCPVTTGCENAAGVPVACRCSSILSGDPVIDLIQAGPAFVRTRDSTVSRDAFLRYEMRTGDLQGSTDSDPDLMRFALSNLELRPTLPSFDPQNPGNEGVRGIPVASPRWRIRLKPTGLLSPSFMREFLTAIEDVRLRFNYEAFNLP